MYVVQEAAGTSAGGGSTRLLLSDWGGSKHLGTKEAHGQGHASVGTTGYAVADEELSWAKGFAIARAHVLLDTHGARDGRGEDGVGGVEGRVLGEA